MTPSQPPPLPEKLLERVLRVAGLLTAPAEPNTEKELSGNPSDSMIPAVEMESDDTAKPVKRHFPVK
ncbi:hypothetical protein FBR02_13615 [Anaerolineae bacterium CFX9]|jgi:hypothetical protein|nr:hypothetical protein [Anaerolineae bacterium CFX9]